MLLVIGSIVLVMALALYLPLFQSYMNQRKTMENKEILELTTSAWREKKENVAKIAMQ